LKYQKPDSEIPIFSEKKIALSFSETSKGEGIFYISKKVPLGIQA
jgi:hypothetical protein